MPKIIIESENDIVVDYSFEPVIKIDEKGRRVGIPKNEQSLDIMHKAHVHEIRVYIRDNDKAHCINLKPADIQNLNGILKKLSERVEFMVHEDYS